MGRGWVSESIKMSLECKSRAYSDNPHGCCFLGFFNNSCLVIHKSEKRMRYAARDAAFSLYI